ncbi:phosphate ABC transporter substrate-binding protein PstS [Micromonospora sp. BRA006-A]|nr:phosphate ABC transporter substrate-binding protein PstS [Micromonospora sp. BRA006-A]
MDCATGTLNAQGSSAQKNAMAEWIKVYQQKCAGTTINYEPSGLGAGIQAFIAGTADFAGSDSPSPEQPQADAKCTGGQALNLPMVIGPVAVVYNVGGADNLQFSPATLAKIFAGKVTKWDDAAIKADNPDAKLPSTAIQAVHRSDESGTTDNFTKYLSKTAEADWTLGNSKAWKAPGGRRGQVRRCGQQGQEHRRHHQLRRVVVRRELRPEDGEDQERQRRVRRADRRLGRQDHRRRQVRGSGATT